MLFSIALILLCGYSLGQLFEKLGLPSLVGMLVTGIVLGPAVCNVIAPDLLHIAPDLRECALIIILARAGLSLELDDLKAIGRPAVLMCFVPALFEIAAVALFAPLIFGISTLEAGIMGCILAPVSAAVVVPRMLKMQKTGYGGSKKIAQLIMAGTSVDDVLIIVLYAALMGLYRGESFNALNFARIPLAIFTGAAFGIAIGLGLSLLFRHVKMKASIRVLFLLSAAFLLVWLEAALPQIPMSSLLAVMVSGATILRRLPKTAQTLATGLSHLWDGAQIMLFALVGCAVEFEYIGRAGIGALFVLAVGSLFRFAGVFVCLLRTNLVFKERLFCGIAYIPKATVQAAMGAIPLSLGMASGEVTLAVAVLAILLLAPLGAFLIDRFCPRLLEKEYLPIDENAASRYNKHTGSDI